MLEIENKEIRNEKKGLTSEKFIELWEGKKKSEKEKWMYNIVVLKGRGGNLIYADDYRIIGNKSVALYMNEKIIADIKLNMIKFIL